MIEVDPICSVEDAIRCAKKIIKDHRKFGLKYGMWFRGQSERYELLPSVFRLHEFKENNVKQKYYLDGTDLFYQFQRLAGLQERCKSTFDWLCLMRHFELPTRLLDWSENLLVALYFAVSNEEKCNKNWQLVFLNPTVLNNITRKTQLESKDFVNINSAWSIDTAIRAEMSISRTIEGIRNRLPSFDRNFVENVLQILEIRKELEEAYKLEDAYKEIGWDGGKTINKIMTKYVGPVAVFPKRLDSRIFQQFSVFTIFGGKYQLDINPGKTVQKDIKKSPKESYYHHQYH